MSQTCCIEENTEGSTHWRGFDSMPFHMPRIVERTTNSLAQNPILHTKVADTTLCVNSPTQPVFGMFSCSWTSRNFEIISPTQHTSWNVQLFCPSGQGIFVRCSTRNCLIPTTCRRWNTRPPRVSGSLRSGETMHRVGELVPSFWQYCTRFCRDLPSSQLKYFGSSQVPDTVDSGSRRAFMKR